MKIDRDKYISHIKNKEKIFEMRKLLDKIEIVLRNHSIESTDFLDPYERLLGHSILNSFKDIKYMDQGGLEDAERKSLVIFPDYFYDQDIEDHIMAIRISGSIEGLKHRDYLGAILALGIKRNKLGDILIHRDYTDIILKGEIGSFVFLNLDKIGNEKIKVRQVSLKDLKSMDHDYTEITRSFTSLRLDVYLSGVYNLSRSESLNLIRAGRVKVNHEPIDKNFKELAAKDLISLKGYGRSMLYSIEGISKKNKIRSRVRIFV